MKQGGSMKTTYVACERIVSLTCGLLILLAPTMAAAQEITGDTDTIVNKSAIALPGGLHVTGFDISFVDPFSRVFLLADRTNKSLDIADLNTGKAVVVVPTGANAFRGA